MNGKRRVLITSALAMLVLGLAVVPSLAAPEKQFTIVAQDSVSATATTIDVTVYNTTPNGNSNISSLTLTGVGAGLAITAVTPGTGSGFGDGSIDITNISPIKPGRFTKFTLTVTHDNVGCAGGLITWSAEAFTGNSLGGDTFSFKTTTSPATDITTTVAVSCAVGIVAPEGVIVGDTFEITVQALNGNSVESTYSDDLSLSVTGPCTLTEAGTQPASGGEVDFTVSADAVGTCGASATGEGLSGTATASIVIYSDGINCGQSTTVTEEGTDTVAALERTDNGPNRDGTGCVEVPYTLTVSDDEVVLKKDQDVVDQQLAEFQLVITWGVAPGDYGNFKVSVFDPNGIEGDADDYTPANCDVQNDVAVPPPANATQHWCFAGVTIVPSGSDFVAQETFLGSGDPNIRYK